MTYRHVGIVQSGAVQFDDRQLWRNQLSTLLGKRVVVTVKPLAKQEADRSINQNSYYFGVVVSIAKDLISQEYGELVSLETAHETLKENCNFTELVKSNKILKITQSTATLTTSEFEAYLERCRAWILNWFGVVVPLPNEVEV